MQMLLYYKMHHLRVPILFHFISFQPRWHFKNSRKNSFSTFRPSSTQKKLQKNREEKNTPKLYDTFYWHRKISVWWHLFVFHKSHVSFSYGCKPLYVYIRFYFKLTWNTYSYSNTFHGVSVIHTWFDVNLRAHEIRHIPSRLLLLLQQLNVSNHIPSKLFPSRWCNFLLFFLLHSLVIVIEIVPEGMFGIRYKKII